MDYQKYRHTVLWFVPVESGTTYCFQASGSTGGYWFEAVENFDPTKTKKFAKKITVGTTRYSLTANDLNRRMQRIPIKNSDPEYNCHGWVHLALKDMREAQLITEDEAENGFDAMMDATLEATDEAIVYL